MSTCAVSNVHRPRLRIVIIISLTFLAGVAHAQSPEFRSMWATRFEWPDANEAVCKATIDEIMDDLAGAHFNAVLFQVRGQADVLYPKAGFPDATIVGDLESGVGIPRDAFDCIILTQTLQMIYDIRSALKHLHRLLKPGGVLLVTSHGITKIHRREGRDDWGEYWHLTSQSTRRLFEEFFPAPRLGIEVYGNVLTATAHLQGLSAEELSPEELDYLDPDYEVIIGVRAVKALEAKGR